MYDIIIVGAGPAGSNLARLLGEQYKVLIIDKRDLENESVVNSRSKCCGGLLAPDAQEMLAKLELGLPKEILVSPQLFAVRTIDITNSLERLYQRFYININREKFDKWLVSMIPDSVDRRFGSLFKRLEFKDEYCEITFIQNGVCHIEKAKLIVGADGANSSVRKYIDNKNSLNQYVSIQEWFECKKPQPYFTAIFDEKITDFYSWVIPKDGNILVGSALNINESPKEKFNFLKDKLSNYGFELEKSLKKEGAYINRPTKSNHFFTGTNRIALIGEASGSISPSSAEGISYALKSSLFLHESLVNGIEGFHKSYNRKSNSLKFNLLFKNLKIPAMYQPKIRNLVMKSGLLSIDDN